MAAFGGLVGRDAGAADRPRFRTSPDGTTAVVAVLLGARLFVAWAGDSRCLVGERRPERGGALAAVAVTEDAWAAAGGVIEDGPWTARC